MNDLISREAAIDAFGLSEKTRKYGGDHSGYDTMMLYEIQGVLEDLPSAQQWIPCSKRLPEIGKEVLLSEPNTMFIAEYHGSGDPEGFWLVDGYHHYLADVNGCAWMPLPEPYREVGGRG